MIDPVYNGVVPSPVDVRDYRLTAAMSVELPLEFQISPLTPVKNQGATPSCVAHAASSIIEWHFEQATEKHVDFSTEFLYGYRPFGYYIGDGMCLRDVCNTMLNMGDVYETDLSGNHNFKEAMCNVEEKIDDLKVKAYPHRIRRYVRLKSEGEIMQMLINHGPVLVSMKWYSKSKLNKDGIYTYDSSVDYGNHAVVIYGWNETGWLVQNSWGPLWGKLGRFVLPFEFELNEAWGIVDDILDDDSDYREPFKTKLGCLLAKLVNWFVNSVLRRQKN